MKKKNKEQFCFIIPMDIWKGELPVFCNMTEEEILEFTKAKVKLGDWQKRMIPFVSDLKGRVHKSDKGYVWSNDESGLMMMSLPNTKKQDWDFYETLLHESVHVGEVILKHRGETSGSESLAHTVEYVFHAIRKTLKN